MRTSSGSLGLGSGAVAKIGSVDLNVGLRTCFIVDGKLTVAILAVEVSVSLPPRSDLSRLGSMAVILSLPVELSDLILILNMLRVL
jgi:hypothetical protein